MLRCLHGLQPNNNEHRADCRAGAKAKHMIGGKLYADDTTLIKGGYVLTLDPELGDMPHTDVLIQGSNTNG